MAPPSRLRNAHRELLDALDATEREHDTHGFHYFEPTLCEAVALFDREVRRATGRDEIQRRADFTADRTDQNTPYAEAIHGAIEAGLRDYVPFAVLRGRMPRHSNIEFVRAELQGVRRILGPVWGGDLTPAQKSALQRREYELREIVNEAEKLRVTGCQWLKALLHYRELLNEGAEFPTEKPSAEYNDFLEPVRVEGLRLPIGAIREMRVASDSLVGVQASAPGDTGTARGKTTAEEAEAVARRLAKRDPGFLDGGVRDWAAAISAKMGKTCSISTVEKTDVWKEHMAKTGRGRGKGGGRPKAVEFSKSVEAVTPQEGHRDVLDELVAGEMAAAAEAVKASGMTREQQEATLAKLSRDEMSPAEAEKMATMFPPKRPGPVRRFRQT